MFYKSKKFILFYQICGKGKDSNLRRLKKPTVLRQLRLATLELPHFVNTKIRSKSQTAKYFHKKIEIIFLLSK